MSRGEEKAVVNIDLLRSQLRQRVATAAGKGQVEAPAEGSTRWLLAAAAAAGISRMTLKKMLDGDEVTASVFHTVGRALSLPLHKLISPASDDSRLPDHLADYHRYAFGYFIAEDRAAFGAPRVCWYRGWQEFDKLPATGPEPTVLTLRIENELKLKWKAEGRLVGRGGTFLVTAELDPAGASLEQAPALWPHFTALFNAGYSWETLAGLHKTFRRGGHADDRVLVGHWFGKTAFLTPAVHSSIWSTCELTLPQLRALSGDLRTRVFIKAARWFREPEAKKKR